MAERSRTGSAADPSQTRAGEQQADGSTPEGQSGPAKKVTGGSSSKKTAAKQSSTRQSPAKKVAAKKTAAQQSASKQAAPGQAASDQSAPGQTRTQGLGDRLTAAQDEHKANANPASSAAAKKAAKSSGRRAPRRARLRLTRLDPWSVMKTAFLLSIAIGVVAIVSVMIVWSVLGAAGVWDSINATVADVVGTEETSNFDIENYLGLSRVLGFTMLVSAVDVVLLTAIATLMAFLYNMAAALLGGIEVTLAEEDR